MTAAPQYPKLLWVLWQLHRNTLHFCEFCNRSGTPQRIPWQLCVQYPILLCVLWLLYHNTLHFCEFCNRSGTLQRLPSGSVTDPIPYSDYPYPTEPIRGILCIFLEPARTGLWIVHVLCRIPWACVWSNKCSGIPTLQALKVSTYCTASIILVLTHCDNA